MVIFLSFFPPCIWAFLFSTFWSFASPISILEKGISSYIGFHQIEFIELGICRLPNRASLDKESAGPEELPHIYSNLVLRITITITITITQRNKSVNKSEVEHVLAITSD